ncbi:protamine-2 (modular protein) [Mesorhizobium helmanticense]|uniref:Protamine-2 (Modular protein) n=1 Tax=Mesorhizobium helmanticense TaxID=1776423 RepID=A0A2T4IS70_9HYPH|nr:protamine-2 (modular protein) [Mesorhizobium helmanticense]
MDRRLFLTGMFGIAGAAALASAVRPVNAVAGVPAARSGILDELEAQDKEVFEDGDTQAELEPVRHRHGHWRRHNRRRRRRVWRRVCRRYWRHGRRRTRCYRERVWVWYRW